MLQENGGGERIDVAAASARRPFHLANGAERCRGRVSLVDQRHRQAGAPVELGPDPADLFAARRFIALVVQREAKHERRRLQRLGLPYELSDRGALAGPPRDESRRRCDRARGVADRQSDATLSVIDREYAPRRGRHRLVDRGRHPWAIVAKNSLLFFVRFMRSSRNSMASVGGMSPRKLRRRYTRLSSSCDSRSSSFLVPERWMSIAGKMRRSAIFRSSTSSMLPVPLNSSKITSSMREPVSMSAVAMIVSEPPSSMFRAAPKNRFGLCNA